MKKKYYKTINYQQLLISTIKEKYFNLILGMIVSLIISSLAYNLVLKDAITSISLTMPAFNKKAVSPTASKKGEETVKSYVVAEGDGLWQVAEKFYGSGFNAYDIALANNIDPDASLVAGQKLSLPDVKRKESTVGEISAASTTQVTNTENKYVVLPGESLSTIAYKVYGDIFAWPRILKANNLTSPDLIEVGMVLTIPR